MKVVDGRGDLPDDAGDLCLFESFLLEFLVERACVHILQDDVEVRLVIEAAVHLQYVAVLDAALDADLQGQLVDHHVALYQRLWDLLQGEDTVRPPVLYEVHAAELALPELLVDYQVVQDAALGRRGDWLAFGSRCVGVFVRFGLEVGRFDEGR